jgi:hypothetical protein
LITASSSGANSASIAWARIAPARTLTSENLIITRLPAAIASAAGWTTRLTGKFHGPMTPTTPSGVTSTVVGIPAASEAGTS